MHLHFIVHYKCGYTTFEQRILKPRYTQAQCPSICIAVFINLITKIHHMQRIQITAEPKLTTLKDHLLIE